MSTLDPFVRNVLAAQAFAFVAGKAIFAHNWTAVAILLLGGCVLRGAHRIAEALREQNGELKAWREQEKQIAAQGGA